MVTDSYRKNAAYLLELLAAAINNTQPPEPGSDVDFETVYAIAKSHDVLNTSCYAIDRLKKKPEAKLLKEWEFKRNQCVHRTMIQQAEFDAICKAFEENKIEYMPVKGFQISNLYPQPDYRFMSDLDILVRKEQLKKADDVMLTLGYEADKLGFMYDDSFIKAPFMHVELHHELFPLSSPFHTYFEDVFERSHNRSQLRKMSREDNYIYIMTHMYKHYHESGTGIRSVADVYLMNKRYLDTMDTEYLRKEFKTLKIDRFVRLMSDIAVKWFANYDFDRFSEEELYILLSGIYGTPENRVLNRKSDIGSKHFFLKRIFPPANLMKDIFGPVRKFPVLLPVFYVYRIFRLILPSRRNRIRHELSVLQHNNENNNE